MWKVSWMRPRAMSVAFTPALVNSARASSMSLTMSRQWNVTSNRMSVIGGDDAGNEAGVAARLPHAENAEP